MIRDSFYRDIEAGLGGKLDPELFERCAADLLGAVHPTLVPIRGGDDAGMDGAIADGAGLPFPLVTTIGADLGRNLRRNLQSYLARGGTRRAVVFATSQSVSARRRSALEKVARDLGFTLTQIHDRPAFTDLLYRRPEWCQELLGIVGGPPPLSVMPQPGRSVIGDVLVGRSQDMLWLVHTPGDLLVVGQPGVGKTFLLYHFAKEQGGLFAHTPDLGEIAAGIRRENPSALVVENAHLQLDRLPQLRRLRSEMGGEFRIIADSWPGSRDDVARALDVPSASVRGLDLLSQDEIAAVVRGAGIGGPRGLIQEIVNQAEGKPGLAVTLSNLCLRGDVRAVAQGDALAQEIAFVFNRLIGGDTKTLLAVFAAGGDAGMAMQAVADYLEEPASRLRERVSHLAAGGVLVEVDRERLTVRPPALRDVLVRDVFFAGPTSLPIEPLLSVAPNVEELTLTVVRAQHRGARVSEDLVRSLIERCGSHDLWALYSRLGRRETTWIATEHPEWVGRIGRTMLETAPEVALPILLGGAIGDNRALHSHPDHALRQVADWIHAAVPGTPSVLERRTQLLKTAQHWLDEGRNPAVGLHALVLALSPEFERTEPEPGSGRNLTLSFGFVSLEEARAIRAMWPAVRGRLANEPVQHWKPVQDVVSAWAYHPRPSRPLPEPLAAEAASFAGEMLRDLADAGKGHSGFLHWVASVADRFGVDLSASVDADFETLFPHRERGDWRAEEEEQRERATALATRWAQAGPGLSVPEMLRHEEEGRLISNPWPRWTPHVCQVIADQTDDCAPWLEAFLAGNASSDLLQPFLRRLLRDKASTSHQLALLCLDDGRQRLMAAITVLQEEATPEELIDLALERLDGGAQWIESLCLRLELPEAVVRRLLSHRDPFIASAAAIGEWTADPKGTVRESLREVWHRAVLRVPCDEWSLREILQADPSLAMEWLAERLHQNSELWRCEETISAALERLSVDDRRRLMATLPGDLFPSEIVQHLVGNDATLLRELLQMDTLKELHLAPLAGYPNPADWAVKAEAAVDVGYSGTDIAQAAFGRSMSWSGSESAMWNEWVLQFDTLQGHPNPRIRAIGAIGSGLATQRRDEARARERVEEIRGW